MKEEVKQAILKFLSGSQYTEFTRVVVIDIVDIFYLNLYESNQKRVRDLKNKINSTLSERSEILKKKQQLQNELEEFQSEIRDSNDGLICSLLAIEIERYEEKLDGFTILGDKAEKLQIDLDHAIELSVSLAMKLIERNVVTLDQIKNYFYFYRQMGS